jgi:hypothetical protein
MLKFCALSAQAVPSSVTLGSTETAQQFRSYVTAQVLRLKRKAVPSSVTLGSTETEGKKQVKSKAIPVTGREGP